MSKRPESKSSSEAIMFIRTFLIAFCMLVIVTTSVLAAADRLANVNPFDTGDEETVVLEEAFDFLISEDSPFFEEFTNANKVNVLLLGVNSGLADTIMLVSFDLDLKHVDLISIPRDTYFHRQGYNSEAENKINAAYKKDPVNMAKAVSEVLLGIPINYYAIVEYDGIEKIVDSMGGVPMDIEFDMKYKDPKDTPPLVIDIPKGHKVLNGEDSVKFLRFRKGSPGYPGYPEGDIGRVKAQQQFMKNAFKQSLSFDLPKITKTVFDNVKSDITIGAALSIARRSVGISGDDITAYMLPSRADPDPPYYVFPKTKEIEEMLTAIYSPEVPEEETTDGAIN